MAERLILMGVVGRAHGVRGLVRVNAHTEDPDALAGYPLTDKAGRGFSLKWVSDNVAQLSELLPGGARPIADRTEAERLTNTELFAPRSALPAAAADEFYLADLIGLNVRNGAGEALGTIAAVHDYGGGVSLEIAPRQLQTDALIVPFTRAVVPVVDLAAGYAVVEPPAEIGA